ncbi:hypothetical protein GOC60_14690 [Sinorhizobium meliloti]|nr:hypothetical protein [Sinorhizobium meliloti]
MADLSEQPSAHEEFEREEVTRAFRDVFATASGKRVLFWILEQSAIYRDPDCGENTHGTSTVIGEQRVGRKLIDLLDQLDPRLYPRLLLDIADLKAMDKAAANRAAKQEGEDDEDA